VQGFVEGREGVEVVGLVGIDVIGSKAAETRLAGFQDVAAREAGLVGARFESNQDFRRQDDIFAARAQCLTEHSLRLTKRRLGGHCRRSSDGSKGIPETTKAGLPFQCAEDFNLCNRPNLGLPATAIGTSGVEIISSPVSTKQQIQMATKPYF
jgi:hypothetical protein